MLHYLPHSGPTIAAYGLAALAALGLSLAAKRPPTIIMASLLLADWLGCNVTGGELGYSCAPILLPSEDVMWLGFAVLLNRRALHDDLVRLTAYLFLVAIVAWGAFIVTGEQNSYTAYLCANLVYLLQVLVVG